jgi:hypothetical protein
MALVFVVVAESDYPFSLTFLNNSMWKPDKNKVSDKEIIGRRIFGHKIFIAPPERGLFKMELFYDKRFENNLSFDRIGLKTVDKEVVKFLTPQCHEHGKMQNKKFVGWAAIRVSDLKKLEIQATASSENPYHADLMREDFRDAVSAELLAYRLAHHASALELVLAINEETGEDSNSHS